MTDSDRWGLFMLKHFERQRDAHGDPSTWPGYWGLCIMNWTDHLKIVWC